MVILPARLETKKQGTLGRGHRCWRSWEYRRNAATVVGLHRYPSSLVVLGLADHDHTGVEVDIIDVETDGLAHPHAGHGHQPDQRVIRRGGQRPWDAAMPPTAAW